jgi:hypothetical protein
MVDIIAAAWRRKKKSPPSQMRRRGAHDKSKRRVGHDRKTLPQREDEPPT